MSQTKEKFNEAGFFLQEMSKSTSDVWRFKCNLSAFLSFFRSITLIMQKEYAHVSGFEEWYATKRSELESDKEMKFLDDERDKVLHQKCADPQKRDVVIISFSIGCVFSLKTTDKNGNVIEETPPSPLPKPATKPVERETVWYFKEFTDKDALAICTDCMRKMGEIVLECESKFAPKPY